MTDQQILRTAREFRRGLLDGGSSQSMCFAMSAALQGFLSACGCDTELIEVDFGSINHFWLELPDGRILDATADQFGLAPVYLGPIPDRYRALMLPRLKQEKGA